MSSGETSKEILKLACQSIIKDYTDQRAGSGNNWFDRSEEVWRKKRSGLPYPIIPPYPPEELVIEVSKILLEKHQADKVKIIRLKTFNDIQLPANAISNINSIPNKKRKRGK